MALPDSGEAARPVVRSPIVTVMEIVGPDLLVIILLALLLFGGTRLAGLGKGAGRAIREFKEETDSLRKRGADTADQTSASRTPALPAPGTGQTVAAPAQPSGGGSAASAPARPSGGGSAASAPARPAGGGSAAPDHDAPGIASAPPAESAPTNLEE